MINILSKTHGHELSDDVANSQELQYLHAQLEKLITHHHAALEGVGGIADADNIIGWIKRCEEGSAKAERKLYHDGLQMLENINMRLRTAFEEQQRIEEESPSVATATMGRETERYAKASGNAGEALSTLADIAGHSELEGEK